MAGKLNSDVFKVKASEDKQGCWPFVVVEFIPKTPHHHPKNPLTAELFGLRV